MKSMPAGAIIREVWYIYCAMKRRMSGVRLGFFVLGVAFLSVAFPTIAETPVQPSLRLVFSRDTADLGEDAFEARRLLFAAVESKFTAQRRYRIERETTEATPEEYVAATDLAAIDAVVFVRITSRLDGSLRSDFDVFSGEAFVRSGEDELPVGDDRFTTVDRISDDLTDAVASLFPGFGRIRFTNTGYPHNFYVTANGVDIGANIREIDLPVGTYDIEIRRRDDGFSQTVGHRRLVLENDDFFEVVFSMDRAAPPVPGYLRLTNPGDRWRAIYTIRGAGLIPLNGLEELSMEEGWSVTGTTLFGDIPFRGFTTGFEAGYLRYVGTVDSGDEFTDSEFSVSVDVTPLLGTLGLSVGPVSGVDFVVRGSGGIAVYRVTEEEQSGGTEDSDRRFNDIDPAFGGVAEFGFGLGKNRRLSLQAAIFGIVTEDDTVTWLQLGVGLGGRF